MTGVLEPCRAGPLAGTGRQRLDSGAPFYDVYLDRRRRVHGGGRHRAAVLAAQLLEASSGWTRRAVARPVGSAGLARG